MVEEIGGDSKVEWLRARDARTGEQTRIEVGGVFIYVGFLPNSQIFGPEFPKDHQGFLITDDKMETIVPGLYVCGDVRSQYVRQISNAVGDATIAAVAATRYIEELDATGDPAEAEEVERLLVDA
ncbi:MAG: NAD(P)/FAD-dependent oxidoreductase [Chloroflexi bacterium]|nr:NAD(P)/FAD-dependent oxidoreductase [Chloroflexota bacterium]